MLTQFGSSWINTKLIRAVFFGRTTGADVLLDSDEMITVRADSVESLRTWLEQQAEIVKEFKTVELETLDVTEFFRFLNDSTVYQVCGMYLGEMSIRNLETRVVSKIECEHHVVIPVRAIFENETK